MTELTLSPTQHGLWSNGQDDDGKHYAIRNASPFFCLSAETRDDADAKAGRAIESYFKLVEKRDGE